jgi:mannose/fructose-specific phosphotransferase system component IIA
MSEPLLGVVVGHGELARALVSAVEEISGIRGALVPVSNSGCDREQLEDRIVAAIGDREGVVFIDLASGSCLFAAMRRLRGRPQVSMVTGVNLAMLIDFVFHRSGTAAAAAARAAETGGKAVGVR